MLQAPFGVNFLADAEPDTTLASLELYGWVAVLVRYKGL